LKLVLGAEDCSRSPILATFTPDEVALN
jgi:hypothetical protein